MTKRRLNCPLYFIEKDCYSCKKVNLFTQYQDSVCIINLCKLSLMLNLQGILLD